ncbi:1870_t:CDS:2, partial [Funneliformis mosseae]
MAHPINALLFFYHVTEVEEWTCDNLEWTGSYSAFIRKDSTRMNMRVRTISSISQVNNLTGDSTQNFDNCRITSGKRDREEMERASPRLNKKAFSSESSMEGPDIRNYFSRNRSISDPEGRIYSQPQDLDEQLEADLGKFQPITNNEKLNQSKTRADSQKPANKVPTYTNTVKGGKKINTENEIFLDLRSRQIYPLIKPFIKLSMLEAEELYSQIACGINITASLPDDVKQYLERILDSDIKNALGRLDQPLIDNPSPLLLWTREVSRHFILYYHYGGLQDDCNEKTWSTQTIYRLLDLFSVFFSKIVSGKEFGEIDNEAHNDRTYNINYDQKPSNSGCVPKNDAVIYQDKSATIIYEQSYSPKEYTFSHYLGDFSKLARNSVDDLNYYFTRYANCTTATAKTFKSVSIHGYKYNVSVYVTDIIRIKTYRIYEVFSFRIPTSYSEEWNLFDIAKFGALLEKLLINRQDVK